MRLTPLDIRKQEFTRTFRGFDPEEVNAFLQMVANQWEELQDESRRREEKIRELDGKLRHYEKVEEALQEALQTARESSRRALLNAEEKAEVILRQAEARADEIRREAEQDRHDLKRETAKLSGRRSEIVTRLRAFLMSEMELLARYQGDDPVGFIKLLPAEEDSVRRLADHLDEEDDPGALRTEGGRYAEDRTDPRPTDRPGRGPAGAEREVDDARDVGDTAGSERPEAVAEAGPTFSDTERSPDAGAASEAEDVDSLQQDREESRFGTFSTDAPDSLDVPDSLDAQESSETAPTIHASEPSAAPRPDHTSRPLDAAEPFEPETRSVSHDAVSHDAVSHDAVSHDAVSHDAVSHDAAEDRRQPEPARSQPHDVPEQDAAEGPNWTTRTVVSHLSEQSPVPPERASGTDEDGDEGEEIDESSETTTRESSEEIEKIRRILSDLD